MTSGYSALVIEESLADRLAAYFQEQADQPLGDAQLASGRALAPFSRAGITVADNLLAKAERALVAKDQERASRLITRAAALKYDEHERTAPAAYAASMMLFNALTEALERSSEGDSRWVEAALAVLSSTGGWGRSELRYSLRAIRQDYYLERGETRAIDAATAQVPPKEELRDVVLTAEELAAAVTSVLLTLQAYRAALEESGG